MDDDLGVRGPRELDLAGHQRLAVLGDGHGPRTVLDREGPATRQPVHRLPSRRRRRLRSFGSADLARCRWVSSAAELGVSPADSRASIPTPTIATHMLRSVGRPMLRTPNPVVRHGRTRPRDVAVWSDYPGSSLVMQTWTDHRSSEVSDEFFGGGARGR